MIVIGLEIGSSQGNKAWSSDPKFSYKLGITIINFNNEIQIQILKRLNATLWQKQFRLLAFCALENYPFSHPSY